MYYMYYSQISNPWSGFTNQIFSLITGIINAYQKGEKIVIVGNFLNDINKSIYTPINDIFDISNINIFLKQNYDIIIVDRNNIKFEIISAKYGTDDTNYIDLTDYIVKHNFVNNKLFINTQCSFNNMMGDPCFGIIKKFILKYKINNYYIEEIYDEKLTSDIIIDFDGCGYVDTFGWINSFNDNMFDKILTNITFNADFILKSELIIKKINTNKRINIIHLRLEDDGIIHWSRQNNITREKYKIILEEKYINLIKNYISLNDENIILSSSLSNGVIDFLNLYNYNYIFVEKFFNDREKNAIIDLLVSKYCNNIFIGNFNIKKLSGSTFSYYIYKCMQNNVTKILIDLDNIYDKEIIENLSSAII